MKKAFLLALILIIAPTFIFAMGIQDVPEVGDTLTSNNVVLYLTPFIIFGVGQLIKYVKPLIPGWAMLMIVTGLSTAMPFVLNLVESSADKPYIVQVGFGLLSVVVHQIYKHLTTSEN